MESDGREIGDGHKPITVLAAGDIMLDRMVRPPRIFFHVFETAACSPHYQPAFPLPFLNNEESMEWLQQKGISAEGIYQTSHAFESILLDFPPEAIDPDYPFRQIRSELLKSDIVFGNLECVLSHRGRPARNDLCYRAHPHYARALADSNFKVLSFANNHCMDYGEVAFFDTLDGLWSNGIKVVGAGKDYLEACKPAVFEVRGLRVAFVAFNLSGPDTTYALWEESGVVPLNELTIERTVERIRGEVDCLIASVHWGREGVGTPSSDMIRLAHYMIDAGADVILGHHQHIPGSIEVYKSKPIIYSLGNFIFGHSHHHWTDNMLARIVVTPKEIKRVELLPIGSEGLEQYQPTMLSGDRASYVITFVAVHSELFGTPIAFEDNKGLIEL